MARKLIKSYVPPKSRSAVALDALTRKSAKFKDRREPRKQSRNWRNYLAE